MGEGSHERMWGEPCGKLARIHTSPNKVISLFY